MVWVAGRAGVVWLACDLLLLEVQSVVVGCEKGVGVTSAGWW